MAPIMSWYHKVVSFLLTVVLCALPAAGWWCTGHMLTAEIAQQVMSPFTKQRLNDIISTFTALGDWPLNPDPVQVACWPDDIRGNVGNFAPWHYIATPYFRNGTWAVINGQNVSFTANKTFVNPSNVVSVMNNMYTSLSGTPNTWELSFATIWVTHQMGDIHQPLHCAELVDATFPDSDNIGLNYPIIAPDGTKTSLHSFWDTVCWQFGDGYLSRPLNATGQEDLNTLAMHFMHQYGGNLTEAQKSVYDPAEMAAEGFNISQEFVYGPLSPPPNGTVSAAYVAMCERVAGTRIVLGGYRLARQLEYLLGHQQCGRTSSESTCTGSSYNYRECFWAGEENGCVPLCSLYTAQACANATKTYCYVNTTGSGNGTCVPNCPSMQSQRNCEKHLLCRWDSTSSSCSFEPYPSSEWPGRGSGAPNTASPGTTVDVENPVNPAMIAVIVVLSVIVVGGVIFAVLKLRRRSRYTDVGGQEDLTMH